MDGRRMDATPSARQARYKMKGKVTMVSGKDFHGIMLWSFQIEGSRRYWRCGKEQPPIEEGQWIEFNADEAGNVSVPSIKAIAGEATSPTVGSSTPTTSSTSTGSAMDVGQRLRYQAARRDATRIVVAALHTDHLPHAANVAKGKRLELLEGYVEQVTKTLLEQEERNLS